MHLHETAYIFQHFHSFCHCYFMIYPVALRTYKFACVADFSWGAWLCPRKSWGETRCWPIWWLTTRRTCLICKTDTSVTVTTCSCISPTAPTLQSWCTTLDVTRPGDYRTLSCFQIRTLEPWRWASLHELYESYWMCITLWKKWKKFSRC